MRPRGDVDAPARSDDLAVLRAHRLYVRHWHGFVRTAQGALRDFARAHAEDLVSEVMLDVGSGRFDRLPPVDHEAARFVRGVIRHRAGHLNRRESRLTALGGDMPSAGTGDPWRHTSQSLLARDVSGALRQLTPREREVAALHWLGQCSSPEIAAVLGVSVRTVKELLRRARRKLRVHLAAHRP